MRESAALTLKGAQAAVTPKILHVSASASPARGGTSTAIWTIIESLRNQGMQADLVTTDDHGPDARLSVPLGAARSENGTTVRYFARQTRFYSASTPLATWLLRNVANYDVVHIHGLFGFVPAVAAGIARVRRIPYVLCPHGMLEQWGRQRRRALVKKASIRFIEGPMLERAAAVHFTGESECRQAADLGIAMRSVIFPLPLQSLAMESTCSRHNRTLLFLSRIDAKKGLDILIGAFALLLVDYPDLRLIIAGDGPPELISELKALAEELDVSANIDWPGFVQGAAKHDLMAKATMLVLPSHSENFGYAVAEAMSAGVPVVVSSAVGISDMVARVGAGRVAEPSVASVAEAIAAVLADPSGRAAMSQAGRDVVERELASDVFGARLRALYESIARDELPARSKPGAANSLPAVRPAPIPSRIPLE